MSAQMTVHNTGAPLIGAGVSCVIGFDLHAILGYIGQIVGILSGIVSLAWVGYQFYQSVKRNQAQK